MNARARVSTSRRPADATPRPALRVVPPPAPPSGDATVAVGRLQDLVDVLAGHVAIIAEQASSVGAASRVGAGAVEVRVVALERGIEQLLASFDTLANGIGGVEHELITLGLRQRMTEVALERLYGLCDVLAGGVASIHAAQPGAVRA